MNKDSDETVTVVKTHGGLEEFYGFLASFHMLNVDPSTMICVVPAVGRGYDSHSTFKKGPETATLPHSARDRVNGE